MVTVSGNLYAGIAGSNDLSGTVRVSGTNVKCELIIALF